MNIFSFGSHLPTRKVAAESTVLEDIDTGKVERQYRYFKAKYLQLYLNMIVYKINRRYFGERIFYRLVIAGITVSGH